MIKRNPKAGPLVEAKEKQETPPPITQPEDEPKEQEEADGGWELVKEEDNGDAIYQTSAISVGVI